MKKLVIDNLTYTFSEERDIVKLMGPLEYDENHIFNVADIREITINAKLLPSEVRSYIAEDPAHKEFVRKNKIGKLWS